jgi:alpha-glucosidase (family GH31 glycosyl hydrolase)
MTQCICAGADGRSHGLLLLNSNAMDAVVGPSSVSFRVTGGLLDVFVLVGPSPAAVLDQLTRVVGRPALPPHWALGFHQCK